MDYNIIIFDKNLKYQSALDARQQLLKLFRDFSEEGCSDYHCTSQELQEWFLDMKDIVRPSKGEFALSGDQLGTTAFHAGEYRFCDKAIWLTLDKSDGQQLYDTITNLAQRHDVAYWAADGTGAVFYPDGEILKTRHRLLLEEYWQRYSLNYSKEEKRREIISLLLFLLITIALFVAYFIAPTSVGLGIGAIFVVSVYLLDRWNKRIAKDVSIPLSSWYQEELKKLPTTFISIELTRCEDGPEELSNELPINCIIMKLMPGSDRSDYMLAYCSKTLFIEGKKIKYMILGQRFYGTVYNGNITAFNVATVIDESLLDDDFLDFNKMEYIAICDGIPKISYSLEKPSEDFEATPVYPQLESFKEEELSEIIRQKDVFVTFYEYLGGHLYYIHYVNLRAEEILVENDDNHQITALDYDELDDCYQHAEQLEEMISSKWIAYVGTISKNDFISLKDKVDSHTTTSIIK